MELKVGMRFAEFIGGYHILGGEYVGSVDILDIKSRFMEDANNLMVIEYDDGTRTHCFVESFLLLITNGQLKFIGQFKSSL